VAAQSAASQEGLSSMSELACSQLLHASFLLRLSFDHEDGGHMSDSFERTTRHYIPEGRTLHNHCCENLKFHPTNVCSSFSMIT
jgi:hypothetical protein